MVAHGATDLPQNVDTTAAAYAPTVLPAPPRRALTFHIGGVEFVLRPAALLLFGGIAGALDVIYLPLALPDQLPLTQHVVAIAMMVLMILGVLLHESGHALAYRLQGIWPVRITLRGTGGACAAMVYDDSPGRALVRALAGPAVTAALVGLLVALWRTTTLPESWRLVAATLCVFSLGDLVFNTLPVHSRCDGTHALRALLWLVRRREPDRFSVLYLWRPTVLAAALLAFCRAGAAGGYLTATAVIALTMLVLALCAVPPAALAWRCVAVSRQASAVS